MKNIPFRIALILLVLPAALTARAQTTFYGGDFDGNDAFASQRNAATGDSSIYDDFTLGSAVTVTSLYGNFFTSTDAVATGLHYEIRRGVSSGIGGTLVTSGNVTATATNNGTTNFGLTGRRIASAPVSFNLAAGTYFLSLAAILNGAGGAYLATTDGTNGVGGPLANGNSFVNNPSQSFNFSTTSDAFGNAYDFSQGLVARPVPEPATMAALGLGFLAAARRRRRA